MPKEWDVTDPATGRTIVMVGDQPPSEAEIRAEFAKPHMGPAPPTKSGPHFSPLGRQMTSLESTPEQRASLARFAPGMAAAAAAIPTAGLSIPLTAGLSVPTSIPAAGGAAGLTSLMRSWLDSADETMPEALSTAGKEMLFSIVGQAGGELLSRAAPGAKRLARNWWVRAVKPSEDVLTRTQTMLKGGTMAEAADEVADTALSMGRGTLRSGNVKAMHAALDALDARLANVITSSTGTVPKQQIEQALLDYVNKIDHGTLVASEELSGVQKVWDNLQRLPDQIPVERAQALKQQIYRTRDYVAGGRADTALASAEKVAGRSLREGIATAEPSVSGINADLSKQIPATSAMEKALRREGNKPPVSMVDAVNLTNPTRAIGAAASIANKPMTATFAAQRLYDIAPFLQAAGVVAPNFTRVITALLFSGHDPQESPTQ